MKQGSTPNIQDTADCTLGDTVSLRPIRNNLLVSGLELVHRLHKLLRPINMDHPDLALNKSETIDLIFEPLGLEDIPISRAHDHQRVTFPSEPLGLERYR